MQDNNSLPDLGTTKLRQYNSGVNCTAFSYFSFETEPAYNLIAMTVE